MLDKLCSDIIYELTKYISFKEICIIKCCNKKLKSIISSLENNIVIHHLNLYYENEIVNDSYNKIYRIKNNNLYSFYNLIRMNINNYYNQKLTIISENDYINFLYKKITMYCLKNKCDITGYPYLFDLFVFYMLINIDVYVNNNIYNKYVINFLNLSTPKKNIYNDIFYDLKIKFYVYINSYTHHKLIKMDYDTIYPISRYLLNICTIKKIFMYKKIDFLFTKLYYCCHYCAFRNLKEICNIKRFYYKDKLILENYNNFKHFLSIINTDYYNFLLNRENIIVNDMIYVKNPITNKRMRINGRFYKNKMLEFYNLDYTIYKNIDDCIKNKRTFLKLKFFN